MEKLILILFGISVLTSCTEHTVATNNGNLAVANLALEIPSASRALGFESRLRNNVNFEFLTNQTNTLEVFGTLSRNETYTLLAPMDYAFQVADKPKSFKISDYIIEGDLSKNEILSKLKTSKNVQINTLSGMPLDLFMKGDKIYVSNSTNRLEIVFTDIETDQNVMHVVSDLW